MAAVAQQTPTEAAAASGYDEFVKDSEEQPVDIPQIMALPSSNLVKKLSAEGKASLVGESSSVAPTVITDYFPPKSAEASKLAAGKGAADEVPELTASSSSEKSESSAAKLANWADKIGQCHLDTACGKLELEFMKKEEEKPVSKATALTEQGELLQIEGAPPPKPWSQAISEKVNEAQAVVSKRSTMLLIGMGLVAKKEQHLVTEYYKPKEVAPAKSMSERSQGARTSIAESARGIGMGLVAKKEQHLITEYYKPKEVVPAKSMSERFQGARTSIAESARGLFAGANAEKQEAEKKQKLMTDFDPTKSPEAAANLTEEEIPAVVTIATEPTEYADEPPTKKASWWSTVTGIFKLPAKVSTPDIPSCEDVQQKLDLSKLQSDIMACVPIGKGAAEGDVPQEKKEEQGAQIPVTPKCPQDSKLPW